MHCTEWRKHNGLDGYYRVTNYISILLKHYRLCENYLFRKKKCNRPITKDDVCNEALNVNIENKEFVGKKRTDIEIHIDNVRKSFAKSFFLLYKTPLQHDLGYPIEIPFKTEIIFVKTAWSIVWYNFL